MKFKAHYFVLAGALSVPGVAQASGIGELEPNHPIVSAQEVDVPESVEIGALMGQLSGTVVEDLDFYRFFGQAGDVVTVDIDGGFGGAERIDTIIAVFSTDSSFTMLRFNDDSFSVDEGSVSTLDSRIDNFRLPETGHYIAGVSTYPRYFDDGGMVINKDEVRDNGDYSLVISGVSSPIQHINIEIKPGNDGRAPINPKSRGKIPVALLSSNEFNAVRVDKKSLTFGPTGHERSLSRCGGGEDVDGDGRLDLVCHFNNRKAGFQPGDLEGIVRGKTGEGKEFEGRGLLKVVPQKRW